MLFALWIWRRPFCIKRSIWCQNYEAEIIKIKLVHWLQDKGKNNKKSENKKLVRAEQEDNNTMAKCLQQDATNKERE